MKRFHQPLMSLAITFGLLSLDCNSTTSSRSLVLVDGSSPEHASWISERVTQFKSDKKRDVRVLRVTAPDEALHIAERGDADIALVPESTSIDAFVASEHGSETGRLASQRLRVLVVNSRQHPKVDESGGRALAEYLAKP